MVANSTGINDKVIKTIKKISKYNFKSKLNKK